ncbi:MULTISPECIES: exodeoxyribonuclease VII small subunit [Kamptonema]|uniref:exodeoxyribonuclease VII small subunit n=1 Tax=Kamptonema TaxID=1501433 RepID=UPI0001DAD626|nr:MULTISPECIES: exodeoxyribonuclease VII small subunit [Kamptonema]CBN56569.1 Exodeoxyribonuclease 7 small subunit [Kamptonema sp. PCC 6506]
MIDFSQRQSDWKYETTVAQLEEIINRVESGELLLEEVFEQFAMAVEYLQQCETFLVEGKEQMNLLIETLNDEPGF